MGRYHSAKDGVGAQNPANDVWTRGSTPDPTGGLRHDMAFFVRAGVDMRGNNWIFSGTLVPETFMRQIVARGDPSNGGTPYFPADIDRDGRKSQALYDTSADCVAVLDA